MGDQAGLVGSFVAAIQASLSVLLVIFYGGIAAHYKLLDSKSTKSISKICVKMFLPALLLTKIGSELHAGSAHRYVLILAWAFVCHFVSFLIGIGARYFFKMPDWITVAIMFNNTTSYPLLLIQSLDETGILSSLVTTDETTREAIERAKSYFLVFSTVSSCLTFAVGPRLIDSEHAPDPPTDKDDSDDERDDEEATIGESVGPEEEPSPGEETRLLFRHRHSSVNPVTFFPATPRESVNKAVIYERRPSLISKRKWYHMGERSRWWLLFFFDFLNAPLLGAVLGAIIGIVPALHTAFFSDTQDGGIFTAWLTASLKNVGSVFVPLPVVVAGVSLYMSMKRTKEHEHDTSTSTPWLTTAFILFIRFVMWPIVSIAVIYSLAKNTTLLSDDPMLWFTMMLMPAGPTAMKVITMIEVSDADEEDEHKIAKLLTISYIISPVLAFTVVGSLRASQYALEAS